DRISTLSQITELSVALTSGFTDEVFAASVGNGHLPVISTLVLTSTDTTDLSSLTEEQCHSITELRFASSFGPLTQETLEEIIPSMDSLVLLDLRRRYLTAIPDLSRSSSTLSTLRLRTNDIFDLYPLSLYNMSALTTLHLGYTNVFDISPLYSIASLAEVELDETNVCLGSDGVVADYQAKFANSNISIIFTAEACNCGSLDGINIPQSNKVCMETVFGESEDYQLVCASDSVFSAGSSSFSCTQATETDATSECAHGCAQGDVCRCDESFSCSCSNVLPDPAFRQCVVDSFTDSIFEDQETISVASLLTLSEIECTDSYSSSTGDVLSSIVGIEYAMNLDKINLSNNNLLISHLFRLTNIEVLDISSTNISTVAGLSKLTYSLNSLNISNTEINDLSPLFSGSARNFISDPSPMYSLMYLKTLFIQNNPICGSNVEDTFKSHSKTSYESSLDVSYYHDDSWSCSCRNVDVVNNIVCSESAPGSDSWYPVCMSNSIAEYTSDGDLGCTLLDDFESYCEGGCFYSQECRQIDGIPSQGECVDVIEDSELYECIYGLLSSEHLMEYFAETYLSVASLKALDSSILVQCDGSDISNLNGIQHLTNITHLSLTFSSQNYLFSLSPLATLTNLTVFSLIGFDFIASEDLSVIANLSPFIEELDLSQTVLSDSSIDSLSLFSVLSDLVIAECELSTLPDLSNSKSSLINLDFQNNSILSLTPLSHADLSALQNVNASNNLIVDPSPLYCGLSTLCNIDLSGNYICFDDESSLYFTEQFVSVSCISTNYDISDQNQDNCNKCSDDVSLTDNKLCEILWNDSQDNPVYGVLCSAYSYKLASDSDSDGFICMQFESEDDLYGDSDKASYCSSCVENTHMECAEVSSFSSSENYVPVSIECQCTEGWYGSICDSPCPVVTSDDVDYACGYELSPSHGVCDIDSRECTCSFGYQNENCDLQSCSDDKCSSSSGGGECVEDVDDESGAITYHCECPDDQYVSYVSNQTKMCVSRCHYNLGCKDGATCSINPNDTYLWRCECPDNNQYYDTDHFQCISDSRCDGCTNGSCIKDGSVVSCVCDPDWYGSNCDKLCPVDDLENICSNNGYCDESAGKCVCNDGFEGSICENLDVYPLEKYICVELSKGNSSNVTLEEGTTIDCTDYEIKSSELQYITALNLSSSGITNLDGLRFFTKLTELNVDNLEFSDDAISSYSLSEISNLSELNTFS
ncbi:hypothetical protein ADUPG1_010923, partial [Aduncisulcus paluster]